MITRKTAAHLVSFADWPITPLSQAALSSEMVQNGDLSMQASQAFFLAAAAVVLSMAPQLAEAGPCSGGIAELEKTIPQPGVEALAGLGQQSVSVKLSRATPGSARRADEHLQWQFSATVARAKRLDMHGDRVGCTGALNAARGTYVLVAKR
jgi:hypothetical protein